MRTRVNSITCLKKTAKTCFTREEPITVGPNLVKWRPTQLIFRLFYPLFSDSTFSDWHQTQASRPLRLVAQGVGGTDTDGSGFSCTNLYSHDWRRCQIQVTTNIVRKICSDLFSQRDYHACRFSALQSFKFCSDLIFTKEIPQNVTRNGLATALVSFRSLFGTSCNRNGRENFHFSDRLCCAYLALATAEEKVKIFSWPHTLRLRDLSKEKRTHRTSDLNIVVV